MSRRYCILSVQIFVNIVNNLRARCVIVAGRSTDTASQLAVLTVKAIRTFTNVVTTFRLQVVADTAIFTADAVARISYIAQKRDDRIRSAE